MSFPLTIPNCQLWLDSSDANTLFDSTVGGSIVSTITGGPVARWEDKSGNARHATQSTVAARPNVIVNSIFEKSTLNFDGVNDNLSVNSIRPFLSGSHSLFAVARTFVGGRNTTTENTQMILAAEGYANGIGFFGAPIATSVYSSIWDLALIDNSNVFTNYTQGTLATITRTVTGEPGVQSQHSVNNLGRNTGTGSLPVGDQISPGSSSNVRIGSHLGGTANFSWYLSGDVCELLLYNRVLTGTEQLSVQSYLFNKWQVSSATSVPGLQIWLDASDVTTLSGLSAVGLNDNYRIDPSTPTLSAVGFWGDKSGNNRHFLNMFGTTANRPSWISSLSAVRFNGSTSYLTLSTNQTYNAQTVFAVVKQNAIAGAGSIPIFTQVLSGGGSDQAGNNYVPFAQQNSSNNYVTITNGSLVQNQAARFPNNFDIFTSVHTGSAVRTFLNGVGSSTTNTHFLTGDRSQGLETVAMRLGTALTNTGQWFNGDICELMVYNKALTDQERITIEYYLVRKWGFLNPIPRQVYAIRNGNWNNTLTWSTTIEPSGTSQLPLTADNVYANTYTVSINTDITQPTGLRTTSVAPHISAGGTFTFGGNRSINLFPSGPIVGTTTPLSCIGVSSAGTTAIFAGNLTGGSLVPNTFAIVHSGLTNLNIIATNCTGGTQLSSSCLVNSNRGNLNVYAHNCIGGSAGNATAVTNLTSGTVNLFLTGNILGGTNATAYGVYNHSTGNILVSSNALAATGPGAWNNAAGNLTIIGNVSGAATTGVVNNGSGNVYITAPERIVGGTTTNARGVQNNSFGNIYITGNCLGGTGSNAHAVLNSSLGAVIINGNVSANPSTTAGLGAGVVQSSDGSTTANATNGTLIINGNIQAGPGQHGVVSGSTSARNQFTGSLINDLSGRQAVYASRFLLSPKTFDSYTRIAGPSSTNIPVFFYSPENYHLSYVPHVSSVRVGTTYAAVSALSGQPVGIPTQLEGTMNVPSPLVVATNVPVDNTVGSTLTQSALVEILNSSIYSLSANSIGERIKNAVEIHDFGEQMGSINI